MGIDISLALKPEQSFTLTQLLSIMPKDHRIGISDIDYSLTALRAEANYSDCYLTIYNAVNIGRGFSIALKEDKLAMRLNTGCAAVDIDIFHYYLKEIIDRLQIKVFHIDNTPVSVASLEDIFISIRVANLDFIKNQIAAKKVECVWGALFPIFFEDDFLEKLANQSGGRFLDYYGSYLDDKQQIDAYYCKNLIYESKNNHSPVGMYVLTEDIPSIFPTAELDPFFSGNVRIDRQIVGLVYDIKENDSHQKFQISYDDFISYIDLSKSEPFDKKRVIYTLIRRDIEKLLPYRIA